MRLPRKTLICFVLAAAFATNLRTSGDEKRSGENGGQLSEYQEKQIGLKFPKEIGRLKLDTVHKFESAEAGVGIRYRFGDLMSIDCFVFNGGLQTIPADVDSREVRKELNSAIEDIEKAGREGNYPGLEMESQAVADLVKGGPKAHTVSFRFGAGDLQFRSRMYLVVYKSHFIKLRTTWMLSEDEAATKELNAFLTWLAGSLKEK